MKQGEVRNHAINGRGVEWQILRVAVSELDLREHFLRDPDHLPGEVDPDWNGPALGRGS